MKGLIKYAVILLLFTTSAFAYYEDKVESYECDPCCTCYNWYTGLYVALNGGYSWYNFTLHRPPSNQLFPLNFTDFRFKKVVPLVGLGYDIYPRAKIPLRFELNLIYADISFSLNPLFPPQLDATSFSDDNFIVRNIMTTLYFDLHTCTRFVPYVGVSLGYAQIKTGHEPLDITSTNGVNFVNTTTATSWGGTMGTRFFFTDHFIANFQLRYTDLRELAFYNTQFEFIPLAGQKDYFSDYLHEVSALIGITYEF